MLAQISLLPQKLFIRVFSHFIGKRFTSLRLIHRQRIALLILRMRLSKSMEKIRIIEFIYLMIRISL